MIKAVNINGGTSVTLELDANEHMIELMEEFTAVVKAVYERFKQETHSEKIANALVAGAGRMAFAVTDEDHEAIIKDMIEALDSESERMFGFKMGDLD